MSELISSGVKRSGWLRLAINVLEKEEDKNQWGTYNIANNLASETELSDEKWAWQV